MFLAIAKAMEEMVEDPIECYWLVSCFVNQLNSKHKDSLQQLVWKKHLCCFYFLRGEAVMESINTGRQLEHQR